MRRRHFEAWAPHCPICARDHGTRPPLLLAEGAVEQKGEHGDDITAATLVCGSPACRAEYPVIDGIPIVLATLRQHLGDRAVELLLRDDLDDRAWSLLGDAMGPDSWFDVMRAGLSTYGWDAYADLDPAEASADLHTTEVPSDLKPGAASRVLAALLNLAAGFDPASATRVLDLGCGAGRTAFDAAAACPDALVLGIEGNLALLRLARRAAVRGEVAYSRRRIGLVYDPRRFPAALPGRDRVDFWACDATALPFAPGAADLVLALNVLDCVPDPVAFLHAAASLLRPGGALLLATPFDWAARATQAAHWIGGHSQRGPGAGAAEPLLRSLLDGTHPRAVPGLHIAGQGEAAWHTRLHDRASVSYRTHLVASLLESFPERLDKRF